MSATVRLVSQPPPKLTALATFDEVDGAARAAARLTATGNPTLVELMDRSAVHAIDRHLNAGLTGSVGGVLLVQADNVSSAGAWFELALAGSIDLTVTDDEFEANYLVDFRRAAYPAAQTLGKVLVEDVAVPVSRLPELIAAIEHVGGSHGIDILTVAHAGDGNAHPLMVVGPGVDAEEQIWRAADAIFTATRQLGGTVSGEHGIGRLKRKWLSSEVGPEGVQLMHRIKSAFDPLGIMNPGSLLP
ncbi:MAG TPA: FAD-linked oxidase C-terminal domain-containing protein [Acidimicrobiales bacterium]